MPLTSLSLLPLEPFFRYQRWYCLTFCVVRRPCQMAFSISRASEVVVTKNKHKKLHELKLCFFDTRDQNQSLSFFLQSFWEDAITSHCKQVNQPLTTFARMSLKLGEFSSTARSTRNRCKFYFWQVHAKTHEALWFPLLYAVLLLFHYYLMYTSWSWLA